jgi:hypothetical protein
LRAAQVVFLWEAVVKKTSLLGLVAISLLTLAGCGDPIVGSWEGSDKSCGSHRNEFTIDGSSDDLTGDGSFWFGTNGGGCVKCSGDISGKQKREGQYTFSVKFGGGNGCSPSAAAAPASGSD